MPKLILTLAALLLLTAIGHAADDPPPVKILLIGHQPDHAFGSHMYLFESGLLAKCLQKTPGVTAIVSDGWPKDPATLIGVRAIVCYTSPAGDLLLKGKHAAQFEELLAGGAGFTAIHWATGTFDKEIGPKYQSLLGGWFHTDFSKYGVDRAQLQQADPDHPISRGWKPFDLREEFYRDLKFQPEAKPVFTVKLGDQEQVVGWIYERPGLAKGRSFGTTLGHFHDNFANESFRRAIVNGILWTADVEIPEAGAPVDVTAKDLDLGLEPKK